MLGELYFHIRKNETGSLSLIIYRNQLQMSLDKFKIWKYETTWKCRTNALWGVMGNDIFDKNPKHRKVKQKIEKWDYVYIKSLCMQMKQSSEQRDNL